jgi:hypothetical protein
VQAGGRTPGLPRWDVRPWAAATVATKVGGVQIDATGSEVLDDEHCLELLQTAPIGRLALTRDALPVIIPVAFALLGHDPVIRAGSGPVWDAGERGTVLCFEADSNTAEWSAGWSVAVIGRAEPITDPDELAAARLLKLPVWRPDPDGADGFVRIRSELISGRRFTKRGTAVGPTPSPVAV